MTRMGVPFPLSKRARPCAGGWVDHCPAHDDREPSLSVRVADDGRLLLYCHAGCRFADILTAAGISGRQPPRVSPAIQREIATRDDAHRQARVLRAQAIWQQGRPIEGTLAGTYLGSRGITVSIGVQSGPRIGAQKGPLCPAGSRPEAAELSSGADGSGRRGAGLRPGS